MKKLLGIILSLALAILYIVPVKAATDIDSDDIELQFRDILEDERCYAYTGKAITPEVEVYHYLGDGTRKELKEGIDYNLDFEDNIYPTLYARAVIYGIGDYTGEASFVFRIKKFVDLNITLSKTKYVYDKKAHKPAVKSVKIGKEKVSSNLYTKYYDAGEYSDKNFKRVGTYSVSVRLIDDYYYYAWDDAYYQIVPKGTSIRSLKGGRKKFTVKWKKQTNQTDGYQIKYSLKKNMKKAKTITIENNKVTKKTIKKLKRRRTYYVRVRTFAYDDYSGKICSSWSKRKAVRVK